MYINSNYGGTPTSDITVMKELILNVEPLLFQNQVNLAFYGHNHVVQRQSAGECGCILCLCFVYFECGCILCAVYFMCVHVCVLSTKLD